MVNGYCGYAAHTIGHRNVIVENNIETEVDNNDTSITNDVLGGNSVGNTSTVSTVEIGIGGTAYKTVGTLNSTETPAQSNYSRPLVVVVVRGSVTFMDWVIDLGNQFNAEQQNFQAGMKEVIKSLYGCTELCDECNGAGCENAADILHEYGFVDDDPEDDIEENIREENYVPVTGIAAHTIGHREITTICNSTIGGNKNDGSDTTADTTTSSYFDAGVSTIENVMGDSYYSISGSSGENTLLGIEDNQSRQLVVIAVRGSVSLADWIYDFGNQLNAEYLNFQTGMKEVVKSLYGCTELCDECNGAGCENAADILHEYGFVDDDPEDDVEENIWEENYVPVTGIAAHTIAKREIKFVNTSVTEEEDNDDNTISYGRNIGYTDGNLSTTGLVDTRTGSANSESNEVRQLVVVSVRGSVTPLD